MKAAGFKQQLKIGIIEMNQRARNDRAYFAPRWP